LGAVQKTVNISTGKLATRICCSQQTASRHLKEIEELGLIRRTITLDGTEVSITDRGFEELVKIYLNLKTTIEGPPSEIVIEGSVFSGFNDGAYYMSRNGYQSQIEESLSFSPYPGTLNIKLNRKNIKAAKELEMLPSILIKGFKKGKRHFGDAKCYPATINDDTEGAVIFIERTHYDDSALQVIAPIYLRSRLDLRDGDKVTIRVSTSRFIPT
jgi:riboflavin kinase